MVKRLQRCQLVADRSEHPDGGQAMPFNLMCGESMVAYESLFHATRVTATLVIEVDDPNLFGLDSTFTVTAERIGHPSITRTIAPSDTDRTISWIVDGVKKITFSCSGTPDHYCAGYYSLRLHWCKCC